MYYDNDADLGHLEGRTVAVIGFGSQGHAHALNLRDAGVDVIVGLRDDSESVDSAKREGLSVTSVAEAATAGDIIVLLVPDEKHGEVYEQHVQGGLDEGNMLLFGHGFSVHYEQVAPPGDVDVALVAPKGPGHLVRRAYAAGAGVPGLLAIHRDATGRARDLALAYAKGIGCTRSGVIETGFKDETETDLFGEQTVICGGISALVEAGFETLTEAGYDPQVAYLSSVQALKGYVDLMHRKGIDGMFESLSARERYGAITRGPRVVEGSARQEMRRVLDEVQSGDFALEWLTENRAGTENFERLRSEAADSPIEHTRRTLREPDGE